MHRLDACLCLACSAAAILHIMATAAKIHIHCKTTNFCHLQKKTQIDCHALSIAGVELMPFHVKGPSLPELTPGQWNSLIQSSHAASTSSNNVAAVLLAEPHFVQVQSV